MLGRNAHVLHSIRTMQESECITDIIVMAFGDSEVGAPKLLDELRLPQHLNCSERKSVSLRCQQDLRRSTGHVIMFLSLTTRNLFWIRRQLFRLFETVPN